MSTLIDDAVKVLRGLPDDMQAAVARAIIEYGASYDDVALSDEQVHEVERRIADPDRNFLSLSAIAYATSAVFELWQSRRPLSSLRSRTAREIADRPPLRSRCFHRAQQVATASCVTCEHNSGTP